MKCSLFNTKPSESKVKFRQASNCCKRILEGTKLAYTNKTKEYVTSKKLGSQDVWQIANSALHKGKSPIPSVFNDPEVMSSTSDKAELFAKNYSKNSNLDDQVCLNWFSLWELILKLHESSVVTPKMVKRVITNLDSLKGSGPDCILVVWF